MYWLTATIAFFFGLIFFFGSLFLDVGHDLIILFIDGIMSGVIWAFDALFPDELAAFEVPWSDLGTTILGAMTWLGVHYAFGIIITALLFKLALRALRAIF